MSKAIKNFDSFFTLIYPRLEELEIIRSKAAGKISIIKKNGIISLLILTTLAVFIPAGFTLFLLFLMALTFWGLFAERVGRASKELRPLFKNEVIRALLNYFYDDVRYVPVQRVSPVVLEKSLLFDKTVRRTTGDDYTECRIGNTYIHFSEVQAFDLRDNYFFNGIFIAVEFNKHFTSKTIIIPRFRMSFFKRIKMNLRGKMKNASTIKLEDIVFSKKFLVIGEDQVESRYKLTTSLMQRMLDYQIKVNRKVAFSLVDNWLYVSIPTNVNLFEASVSKSITDKELIRSSFDYFQLLTGLVNDLDLNTRIWK